MIPYPKKKRRWLDFEMIVTIGGLVVSALAIRAVHNALHRAHPVTETPR